MKPNWKFVTGIRKLIAQRIFSSLTVKHEHKKGELLLSAKLCSTRQAKCCAIDWMSLGQAGRQAGSQWRTKSRSNRKMNNNNKLLNQLKVEDLYLFNLQRNYWHRLVFSLMSLLPVVINPVSPCSNPHVVGIIFGLLAFG